MSFSSPSDYVQLPFTTDPTELADEAVTKLQGAWTGWQPNDGDLEVVLIEALAPMAANAAQIASNMPPAALIALGTKLLGVAYQPGVSASATATFTVKDANGPYDIPAGSEIDLAGVAFQTTADLVIPNGSTTGSVTIAANDVGAFANGLTAGGWSSVNLPVYVTGMTLSAATSGGVDQQDDNAYLNTIAAALQLRARSVITLIDYEIEAVTVTGIARASAVAAAGSPRNITVYVTDSSGNPVASATKSTLSTLYTNTRVVNAVVSVSDPTYTTVSVTYEAVSLPGVDPVALQSSINARLAQELSPAGWGLPGSTNGNGRTWINHPTVYYNRLLGVVASVAGVDYVKYVSISGSNIAQLSAALSTGAAITSLPVTALLSAIGSGQTLTLTDPTGAHTQTWTTTAAVAVGATSIPVTSQTPNFAYPSGSTMSGFVSNDLAMAGVAPLPKPGTFTGTIDTPSS
jgi:hypothetical protein